MDIKDYTLLQIGLQAENRDIKAHIRDFQSYIDVLISLTDGLHTSKAKGEPWQKYLEVQVFKYSLHASSLAELFKGTVLKNRNLSNEFRYPDLGSIYLLSRALIENYLMFYYLNVQPKSFEEGDFKCALYDLSGLNHRQKFGATLKENIKQMDEEKIEMKRLVDKIKTNKFFLKLSNSKQKDLLERTPPRLLGWEKLIESSSLKTEFFLPSWKLYSNYAHSEMISAIQIKDFVNTPLELNATLSHTLEMAFQPTCIMIKDLTKMFKSAEIMYNSLPSPTIIKIDFWAKVGTVNALIQNKSNLAV